VYIKDYGIHYYPKAGQSSTADIPPTNGWYTVFIAGASTPEGVVPKYVRGEIGIVYGSTTDKPNLSTYSSANPIVLAHIRRVGSTITNADIWPARQLIAMKYDSASTSKIKLFESDMYNAVKGAGQTVSNATTVARVEINRNGDNTSLKIADVPGNSADINKTKILTLESNKITMFNGNGASAETKTIQPTDITNWNTSYDVAHEHVYNVQPTRYDATNWVISGGVEPDVNTLRVYKNGLRQLRGSDFTISHSTITFTNATTTDDIVLIDYDIQK
jgi:hypothetical protein